MSRYIVVSDWREAKAASAGSQRFSLQVADVKDTKGGGHYTDGAYRVYVGSVGQDNPRPCKAGKGGTVPFYGESAWSDGERLFNDLVTAARHAR